jgi:C1A family cysteine protease
MPSAEAARAAYDQRSSYFRITSTGESRIDDICRALAGGYAVVFGTLVSHSFITAGPKELREPPVDLENIAGGHAMTVVGHVTDSDNSVIFDVVNSWGPDWCDSGYCSMSDRYLAWDETRDLWIIETAPDFSREAA